MCLFLLPGYLQHNLQISNQHKVQHTCVRALEVSSLSEALLTINGRLGRESQFHHGEAPPKDCSWSSGWPQTHSNTVSVTELFLKRR